MELPADRWVLLAMASRSRSLPVLAESSIEPGTAGAEQWVEVLVDCPGAQDIYTYRLPAGMVVQPGDILSVPFGSQQLGAIALRLVSGSHDLNPEQVRPVEAVICAGFFPSSYWALLNRVASYYQTSLMQVVRTALPPGLLQRSQRRLRLTPAASTNQASSLSPAAASLWQLLTASKHGDYSWQYVQRQLGREANRGLQELVRLGWVENYLEPPTPVRPKLRQAVILASLDPTAELSPRQREVLEVLKRQGGDLWLNDLLRQAQTSSATLKALERKGLLAIQAREVLRGEATVAVPVDRPLSLTPDQAAALGAIQALAGFTQVLLHGVTGSGKTEVYLQAIAPHLQAGQSALVLVPEIGLTPQLTDRFRARFGAAVCVYHSALAEGERYDTWRQMLTGTAQIVIGTRSAIFAPLPKLGLIILDEEHDASFKQDQPAPCYHARTVAQWRAELDQCPLILGSATPALETWTELGPDRVEVGRPSLYLSLPCRVHTRPLPPIEVVDMRQELAQGNRSMFSRSLEAALKQLPAQGNQGILFVPRRGHSTFVSCRSCGYVMACPNCDVSLTYHQDQPQSAPLLRCHYCNHGQLQPPHCPDCSSPYFKHFGSGTQRVAEELAQRFPELRLIRYDSDTTRARGGHRHLLGQFAQGEADILVGTQMLTKGIDLPQVTLVGVVAADGLLHLPDFRASERAFQTLVQVAGRAGRGQEPGRVILQTYTPEHPVIQAVQRQDYGAFVASELQQRLGLQYPPGNRLVLLRLSSLDPIAVQQAAERVAQTLSTEGQDSPLWELLGPAPAPILRVARRYRWQILLKLNSGPTIDQLSFDHLRPLCGGNVSLTIDVDPLQMG